ncbi:NAD-dependent deacylase [Entomobacter blattae]|uniref:NAD-dependent protein deacylase n=1 Tax=Entomobacter blattae TaxID=2762277 RepID=A0A7H1NP13_9PROT|nr:NAD-dependent protein deacylase [Entomobacter blattae]
MRVVVLTGAGISKESGLETFRDTGGIWTRYNVDDVCTPEGFARNPALVHQFYNEYRDRLKEVSPNAAHKALAEWEKASQDGRWQGELLVVTQNIDDLHERAGSKNLLHMHGELLKLRCVSCGTIEAIVGHSSQETKCPKCEKKAMRPHIVWFGEMPLFMEDIQTALISCDLFVSIGTSGTVYPAAGFVQLARTARKVEINKDPSSGSSYFDTVLTGVATQRVPEFVESFIGHYR